MGFEPASTATSDRSRGIGFMLLAVLVFAVMDSLMKRVSARYPPLQIAALRYLVALVFMLVPVLTRGAWRELRATRIELHVLRGALAVIMLVTFLFAVHRLTLAQTYSLYLSAPLMMTALSIPLLHERAAGARWAAIVLGFCGVLIVVNPTHLAFDPLAALAGAVSALCYAISAITLRFLGRTHSSTSLVFWVLSIAGCFSLVLALPGWRPIVLADAGWLIGIGLAGALGQIFITRAFSLAPAAVVAPFEYTAMIWGFLIDAAFWSAWPSARLIMGSAVVVASGMLVLHDERRSAASAFSAENPPA